MKDDHSSCSGDGGSSRAVGPLVVLFLLEPGSAMENQGAAPAAEIQCGQKPGKRVKNDAK